MILFNLRCAKKHEFEAWFASGASFDEQEKSGAIACPQCGSVQVNKAPMAPRIGKSGASEPGAGKPAAPALPEPAGSAQEMRRHLLELRAKVESSCDYVGPQFAEEARRIHYGEVEKRSIYGEASKDEAAALADEGVEFGTIPWVSRDN